MGGRLPGANPRPGLLGARPLLPFGHAVQRRALGALCPAAAPRGLVTASCGPPAPAPGVAFGRAVANARAGFPAAASHGDLLGVGRTVGRGSAGGLPPGLGEGPGADDIHRATAPVRTAGAQLGVDVGDGLPVDGVGLGHFAAQVPEAHCARRRDRRGAHGGDGRQRRQGGGDPQHGGQGGERCDAHEDAPHEGRASGDPRSCTRTVTGEFANVLRAELASSHLNLRPPEKN